MSQLVNTVRRVRWPDQDSFAGMMVEKFGEGMFSLSFSPSENLATFRWSDVTTTLEMNCVVDIIIKGEGGKSLMNRSWQVTNLRGPSDVKLVYPESMVHWASWTYLEVSIRDVTPTGPSGKAAQSHCLPQRQLQRPESTSAATDGVQSGKLSVPIKPVVASEQNGQTTGRPDLKTPLSAAHSEPLGQPPVKRKKMNLLPSPVVSNDLTPAAAAVSSHSLRTSTAVVSEWNQLREENLRLTSTVSELQRKLNGIDAYVELKLGEKAAELSKLQLKCNRLESESSTQTAMVADLRKQLNGRSTKLDKITGELAELSDETKIKSETIDKLNDALKLASEAFQKLQAELTITSEQLQKEIETVQQHKSELTENTAKIGRLSTELSHQQQINCRKSGVISRLTILNEEKTKVEENLRSQLDEKKVRRQHQLAQLEGLCEKELIKQLSLKTISSTICLADQRQSEGLMTECFRFVKFQNGNREMWKDLRMMGADWPDIFAQICAFNGSRQNAKVPTFLFTSGINH